MQVARPFEATDVGTPTGSSTRAAVGATPPWREIAVHGVRLAYDD